MPLCVTAVNIPAPYACSSLPYASQSGSLAAMGIPDTATVARTALPATLSMHFVLTKLIQAEGRHYGDLAYIVTEHPDKLVADGWKLHTGSLPARDAADALFNAALADKVGHAVSVARSEGWGN